MATLNIRYEETQIQVKEEIFRFIFVFQPIGDSKKVAKSISMLGIHFHPHNKKQRSFKIMF